MRLQERDISRFTENLQNNEYGARTIQKYRADIGKLIKFMGDREFEKKELIEFKEALCKIYKPRSVNSILAACNHFFEFMGRPDLKLKQLRIQQEIFCPEEKLLSRDEYKTLVKTAKASGKKKLALIMQTVCSTGIRIGELEFITAEAVKQGVAAIQFKGKHRMILIPEQLRKKLLCYMLQNHITKGSVFVTRNGKPCNRTNIWKEMKKVACEAGVCLEKVFPHNLRHLFAREFYRIKKDIVQLADVLGHSNINTTRIYMISTGEQHRETLANMCLVI